MAAHIEFGNKGEQMAQSFLIKKGYKILKTNYRVGNAEVDIIAEQATQVIFVEVKTRKGINYGNPENFVTHEKRRNMKKVARAFIERNKVQGQARFDIISIVMEAENLKEIKHFEDAFFLK
jgi:putative endonuclease